MLVFWVIQTLVVLTWLVISGFIWNSRFRGDSDQAPALRNPVISAVLNLLIMALPVFSLLWSLIRFSIWIALMSFVVYVVLWNLVRARYYRVVFRQYRAILEDQLRRSEEAEEYSGAEIDAQVHDWLIMNEERM
jgi:hypothetical protein